jgi:hypothetical protein
MKSGLQIMIPHNANLLYGRHVFREIDKVPSDFNCAFGLLHHVVVGDIADVSEVHSASGSKYVGSLTHLWS